MARGSEPPESNGVERFTPPEIEARPDAYARSMRFEVLGPLRATAADEDDERVRELPLGGPKQRLVLALLLASPNEVLSVDRLIDGVWGEVVPGTARHTLQSYVSELRKVIGPSLERVGTGYSLHADTASLDALEFESLVSDGINRSGRDLTGAAEVLRRALDLWRGQPFGGFEHHDPLRIEIARLEELRLTAVEHLMRSELDLGRQDAIIGPLERLTAEHPYREELRALHMLALYRSGRQADALRAFQRTARALGDDLGIIPSPGLARLEQQILVQDPALDAPGERDSDELTAATAPIENPYKGLQAFREGDRDVFHGRAPLIDQIVTTLDGDARMVAVVGPSGSGKSSVIHAGVVPALRERPGGERLLIATMQPGAHPFADLEAALVRAGDEPTRTLPHLGTGDDGLLRAALRLLRDDTGRLLIVIDQFEELFTLVWDTERAPFLRALTTAASDPRRRVQVLVALRADFYDRPLQHREFGRLLTEHVIHVLPLSGDELEAAATMPARRIGLTLEPRVLAALIADVQDQPNALPLFQYALTELYDHRDGTTLTYAGYQSFGGLRRAVPNRADELYDSLDAEQQEAARQLFLRLVAVAGDAEGRRRIPAYELTELAVDVVALQAAIEAFARHRLLTLDRDPATGVPTIEVAHDALLREWKRLREWLDDARADLRLHRGFAAAVDEWLDAGRDDDYLLSGGRLAEYERWAASTTLRLTKTERAFLDAAVGKRRAVEVAEQQRQAAEAALRRRARRRTWGLAASLSALAVVVGAALLAPGDAKGPTVGLFGFDRDVGNSIDDLALGGLDQAARDHGIEPVAIGRSLSDAEGSLADLADDAELVILGFDTLSVLTPEIVAAHPGTTFVMFDSPADPVPGVASFSFAVHEGAFLVGAAAALESESGIVGFLGGHQNPQIEAFRAGFEAGARAVDPDVEVLAAFVSASSNRGFVDPGRARVVATSLYERGADVVFHAAGGSGYGVFEAADEQSSAQGRHLWAIGVDSDQYLELPETLREHTLTSMVKRFDLGVSETIRAYLDGELTATHRVLTLADGAVGYATSGGHLSDATIERLETLSAEIADGRRTVPHVASGAVEPPLGAAEATPVTVTWDGRTCGYEGPTDWRIEDVIRFEISNTSSAAAQVWAVPPATPFLLVGVEMVPGGTGSATLELLEDRPIDVVCFPAADGRARFAEGVVASTLAVRGRAAGTYTTDALGPRLTYTIPEDWVVDDSFGSVALRPPGWAGWPPIWILSDVLAADQTCAERPEPGVGTSAADIATWLSQVPGMSTRPPEPVEIGGLTGFSVDLRLDDSWTSHCRFLGPDPSVATLFRPGGAQGEVQWWFYGPSWTSRYYLLDVPGAGAMVVSVEVDGDQTAWDQMYAAIAPVFDSLAFDVG
jgi:basic membrane lipoprotein Med (substrate-binding protein (PBP1-ABC) superfamily)/DNA-binding SARP family transcriptional activator